jgi:hypothetical protein
MQYMVIEQFKDAPAIYQRLRDRGRLMPEGLHYVDSWISQDLTQCFQLMEADSLALFNEWIANWSDLMDFEVVLTITSDQAKGIALRSEMS